MKALFVSHNTKSSGANKSFVSIIEQMYTKMEIVVLVNSTSGVLIDQLNEIGIKHIYCKYDWWDAHYRSNCFKQIIRYCIDAKNYYLGGLTEKVLNELVCENFDFIYTNTSTVDIGAQIANKLRLPHYWHIREFGIEDFSFKPITSPKYRKMCLNQAEKIIVISEALKSKYKDIVSVNKIHVVYNGLEVSSLKCMKMQHDFSKTINILVTGQVSNAKGQDQAVRAVGRLREKGLPVHLFLAGEVDRSYIDPVLKELSDSHEWVSRLGIVKNMYELRNEMDIELVCSKSEAFGRVTLEAMLHSIPVVGSNRGGTPELIKHAKTGMLFEYGNIEQLEKCISDLISDDILYADIVDAAFRFASSFTIERTANKVWHIFTHEDL